MTVDRFDREAARADQREAVALFEDGPSGDTRAWVRCSHVHLPAALDALEAAEALIVELGEALTAPYPTAARRKWEQTGDDAAAQTMNEYDDKRRAARQHYKEWFALRSLVPTNEEGP